MALYDPAQETREMLKKTLELEEENHKMLKRMERRDRWARIFKIFYWLIIVGTALGAYYFLQPYIKILEETIKTVSPGFKQFDALFKNLPR